MATGFVAVMLVAAILFVAINGIIVTFSDQRCPGFRYSSTVVTSRTCQAVEQKF